MEEWKKAFAENTAFNQSDWYEFVVWMGSNWMDVCVALFWVVVAFCIYFLPSFMGGRKRNGGAIIVLNTFLGWTFLGWVVALVWACIPDKE